MERNHRTIKTVVERRGISPEQAVFWYNMSPKSGQDEETIWHASVYRYVWRHPKVELGKKEEETTGTIEI